MADILQLKQNPINNQKIINSSDNVNSIIAQASKLLKSDQLNINSNNSWTKCENDSDPYYLDDGIEYITGRYEPKYHSAYFYGYRSTNDGPGDQAFQDCLNAFYKLQSNSSEKNQPLLIIWGKDNCTKMSNFCRMISVYASSFGDFLISKNFINCYFRGTSAASNEARQFLIDNCGAPSDACHIIGFYGKYPNGKVIAKSVPLPQSDTFESNDDIKYNEFCEILDEFRNKYDAAYNNSDDNDNNENQYSSDIKNIRKKHIPITYKITYKTIKSKDKSPYHFKFAKNGRKNFQVSNNISSYIFCNEDINGLQQQLLSVYLNDNVKELGDYALANLNFLQDVNFGPKFESIGNYCLQNNPSIKSIALTESTKNIGEKCFENCSSLKKMSFNWFDYDNINNITYQLTSIGDSFLKSTSVTNLILPNSYTSIDNNIFKNSNIQRLVLLGINSFNITSDKCSGLTNNCLIITKDFKEYKYSVNSLTEIADYSPYGNIDIGKLGSLRLGKLYKFTENCIKWCFNENRTIETKSDKFPSVSCPILVIYLDILTSEKSYTFIDNLLNNQTILKQMKNELHFYIFVLSRNADFSTSDSDLNYFKNTLNQNKNYEKEFISLNFYYENKFNTVCLNDINLNNFITIIKEYAEKTDFNLFDYESFNIKLEEPYDEIIPTNTAVTTKGYIPWWYVNGNITTIKDWT